MFPPLKGRVHRPDSYTRAIVSWDTPAILASSSRVSIAGFAEFCKGRGVAPPVEVTRFSLAFAAMICYSGRADTGDDAGCRTSDATIKTYQNVSL